MPATNDPNAAAGILQTSTSMALPLSGIANHARLRWCRAGQREQPVARGGARGALQACAALGQLMVERQSRQMGPDHGQRTLIAAGGRAGHAGGGSIFIQSAELEPGELMEALRQIREHEVPAGWSDQRDAEGQAVGPHRGRHGAGGEVHQVDEIGVVPEPAVVGNGSASTSSMV